MPIPKVWRWIRMSRLSVASNFTISNRFVGHIPKVELVRGDATRTIPEYVKNDPQLLVSLLDLDFDVYKPTKVELQQFLPRTLKGAVIAFNELNLRDWPGETVAALQVLERNKLLLKRFPFGSTISYSYALVE